jgi:hypothetical protein
VPLGKGEMPRWLIRQWHMPEVGVGRFEHGDQVGEGPEPVGELD